MRARVKLPAWAAVLVLAAVAALFLSTLRDPAVYLLGADAPATVLHVERVSWWRRSRFCGDRYKVRYAFVIQAGQPVETTATICDRSGPPARPATGETLAIRYLAPLPHVSVAKDFALGPLRPAQAAIAVWLAVLAGIALYVRLRRGGRRARRRRRQPDEDDDPAGPLRYRSPRAAR